ncbi:MAG: hypothetical protein DMG76_20050 [Acidobacteria bacterium]|nr:MAG: hypothetical protein DMG76_20050 [Acidobacteriota bacterium]
MSSAFLTTKALLPSMVQRGRGCVVNITSVAARFGGGIGAIAYSSAKATLSTMTKGLAREFGPKGIRINAVSPGTSIRITTRSFLHGSLSMRSWLRRLTAPWDSK